MAELLNLTRSFVIIFPELSNAFFSFSLRPIGAELDGGFHPHRSVDGGKAGPVDGVPALVEKLACQWCAG